MRTIVRVLAASVQLPRYAARFATEANSDRSMVTAQPRIRSGDTPGELVDLSARIR